jgi:phosphoribosylanthranilate isomerase
MMGMQKSDSIQPTLVKICGIGSPDEGLSACASGADLLGLNFWPRSRRFVDVETASAIATAVPSEVVRVGLFVNASVDTVRSILQSVPLDLLQFHGDETPAFCRQFATPFVKAFRLKDQAVLTQIPDYLDHPEHPFLVDAFVPNEMGGTGVVASWDLAAEASRLGERMILAGGLTPANVEEAIRRVRPWAVDVASGVETAEGHKEPQKMVRFVEAVQRTHAVEVSR